MIAAEALDRARPSCTSSAAAELGFTYRHSGVPDDWIFIGAELRGRAGEPAAIARRIAEIQTARARRQPLRTRTGGSTFTNPPGHKAWELIDHAGCRGLTRRRRAWSRRSTATS